MFHLNDIVFVKSLFVHIANNQVMQTSCQCYFRLLHFSPLQKQGNHNVQNCNLFWSMSSWLFQTTMWMSGTSNFFIGHFHGYFHAFFVQLFSLVFFSWIGFHWMKSCILKIHIWSFQTIEDYVKGRSHYATHVFQPINHWHSIQLTIKP